MESLADLKPTFQASWRRDNERAMPALLDHLEKTAADNYRKEIDQEENVWRTLPFFVAALAVEVAALTQVKDQLKVLTGIMAVAAGIVGLLAFLCTIVGVFYLLRSIALSKFKYIAREPDLLIFVEQLQEAEIQKDIGPDSGIEHFKRLLARQYSACTDNNRAINQHRIRMRTTAGLFTLLSLVATLGLGALTVVAQAWPSVMARLEKQNVGADVGSGERDAREAGCSTSTQGTPTPSGSEGLVHLKGDK